MSSSNTITSPWRKRELDFIGGDHSPASSPPSSPQTELTNKEMGTNSTSDTNDLRRTDSIDVFMLDEPMVDARPSRPTVVTDILQRAFPYEGSVPLTRTPSIPISTPSRSQSRLRHTPHLDLIEATPIAPYPSATLSKSKKRRKKKNAQKNKETALDTIRGLAQTPVMSGDESDFSKHSFPKRDISLNTSLANSPFLRPQSRTSSITAGLSALRQQMEDLRLVRTSSNTGSAHSPTESRPKSSGVTSVTSGYQSAAEDERPPMESYEIPLNEDFISKEVETEAQHADPLSPLLADVHRRMSAQDFDVLTCLGKGSFGTVHLVKQKATGKLYAQKMFRKASLTVRKSLIEQTKTERAILENINRHPFIVNLYYAFQDHEKLYLILEYAQGGELFTHLAAEKMFPEETAAFYLAEMIVALNYLHETGIVYRDLKPENCLLDSDGHLLLTDFGLSKEVVDDEADKCNSILGTWEYMAPEVIEGKSYDKAVDWWSLGTVAFDLLTGAPPFTGNNNAKIQEKVLKCKISYPFFLTPDAKDLLTRLLRKDPRKRLGSHMPKDMQTFKSHRFFRKLDWKKLEDRELTPPIQPIITDPALAENFSPEFTQLALSPRLEIAPSVPWVTNDDAINPFGGFSYVASKSLFRSDSFLTMAMQMEEDE